MTSTTKRTKAKVMAWCIVTRDGKPVLYSERLPIYWRRKNADQDAWKIGGKVIRVEIVPLRRGGE